MRQQQLLRELVESFGYEWGKCAAVRATPGTEGITVEIDLIDTDKHRTHFQTARHLVTQEA